MSEQREWDLDFRPESYWVYDDPHVRIQATIKGSMRRLMAELALDGDPVGYTDPYAMSRSLPAAVRASRGACHPMLMSGEYLPDPEPGEVEIARVELASTTGDVIAVWARRKGDRIHYRIVTEYDDQCEPYHLEQESSEQPLSMRELIRLMDTAWSPDCKTDYPDADFGIVLPFVLCSFREGYEDEAAVLGFVKVSSAFYPQLGDWYARRAREVLDKELAEMEEAYRRSEEEARRKRQEEDARIRSSAPRSPLDFPAHFTTDDADRVDVALLDKWIRMFPGIQPASVKLGPPRGRWGGMSSRPYIFVDWTEAGENRYRQAPAYGAPSITDWFRSLAEEEPALARAFGGELREST